jgi:predicted ribosome quality control (RQC) complex YloA/Tae2 family protein
MDGLAIAAVLSEITPQLEGARVQAVKSPRPGVFILSLRARSTVRLLIAPQQAMIHATSLRWDRTGPPSPFVMLLRKRLRSARLRSIRQDGWDRVVRLSWAPRDPSGEEGPLQLIAELLGPHGNLVLAEGGRIVAAWRARGRIRPGVPYRPPPRQDQLDPAGIEGTQLAPFLLADDPARALVRSVDGLGAETAARLLAESGDPAALAAALRRMAADARALDPCVDKQGHSGVSPVPARCATESPLSAAMDQQLAAALQSTQDERDAQAARRALRQAATRLRRTRARVSRWLEAADSRALRQTADLLMTHASRIPRGAEHAELEEPLTGQRVLVPLDRSLTPIEQAQRLYRRARRIERGRPVAEGRLERLDAQIDQLQTALADLEAGHTPPAQALQRQPLPHAGRTDPGRSKGSRTIGGYAVEVGRSAADNDALLRRARPQDLWLHVVGAAGAHVIVHRSDRRPIPNDVVRDAARLAMQHSKKRAEARAQVHVAEVRHVRKPRGAPPGLVRLTQADTLTVSVEPGGGTDAP